MGGVVYFADMLNYAAGGPEIDIKNTSGIRLLAVHSEARGMGVGKSLTKACIQQAKDKKHAQVILHTTNVMKIAWAMYEKMGFERSDDLDFQIHGFSIFGFRLDIQ